MLVHFFGLWPGNEGRVYDVKSAQFIRSRRCICMIAHGQYRDYQYLCRYIATRRCACYFIYVLRRVVGTTSETRRRCCK